MVHSGFRSKDCRLSFSGFPVSAEAVEGVSGDSFAFGSAVPLNQGRGRMDLLPFLRNAGWHSHGAGLCHAI